MTAFFVLIGFASMIVGIILFISAGKKQKSRRIPTIVLTVGTALFLVCFIVDSVGEMTPAVAPSGEYIVSSSSEESSEESLPSQSPTQENDLFTQIIYIDNHPQFYDKLSAAKEMWRGYKEVSVDGPLLSAYTDQTLLLIDGINSDDIINDIQIYPNNVSFTLTLDEALKLVSEYINQPFINKFYTRPEAEKVIDQDNDVITYVLSYTLTDKEKQKHKDQYISGRVVVYVETRDNTVQLIRICTDTPRNFYSGCSVSPWDIDSELTALGTKSE